MPIITDITHQHLYWTGSPSMRSLDEPEYRAVPAINASALVEGIRGDGNPETNEVRRSFEGGDREYVAQASIDRMARGTLAHLMLLQPHLVDSRVAVWEGRKRSSDEWDAFADQHEGKLIVPRKDFDAVQSGCRVISAVPLYRQMFTLQHVEQCLFSRYHGLYLKGRVDEIQDGEPFGGIIDLKTTEAGIDDLSVDRTISAMKYRPKMAFYRQLAADVRGVKPDEIKVHLVFVKLTAPYGVNVVQLTDDGLSYDWERLTGVMDALDMRLRLHDWPVWTNHRQSGLTGWETRGN